MMQKKVHIREQMIKKLKSMDPSIYDQKSLRIAKNLYKENSFTQAKHIGITVSQFPEVDTYSIIKTCWELGKVVSVPKCLPKSKKMEFRRLESFNQLEKVYFNLLEPIVEATELTDHSEIDLLIVPGVAYTKAGNRLGFGGGYYDRYLTSYKGATLSLAFEEQILNSLPIENHDQPVQKILTEEEFSVNHD